MRLDLRALGTFNRLAHEGAEHAAASLGQLTATDPRVEATAINLVSAEDLGETFGDRPFVGVRIGVEGGIRGDAVLAVDREGAERLLGSLPDAEGTGLDEGRMAEVGNILLGGFLDGWGDHIGEPVDITPPSYVEGTSEDIVPVGLSADPDHEQVFAFSSELTLQSAAVELFIYLLPETDSFERLVAGPRGGDGMPVPLDTLVVFNHMTKEGAERASDNLTMLTGIETTVEVSHLSFVPVEDIATRIGDGRYVGVVIECLGLPGGYVLVLFEEASGRQVAEALVETGIDGDEIEALHRSAIKEIGNIITSGLVDGWANVLGTAIDITPPKFVHDEGRDIVEPVAARIGRGQEFAFVIDSTLVTSDRQINCEVFALPDEHELSRALNAISIDPGDIDADGPDPIPGMDARYEDL